jgi:hypothetical protein
MQIIIESNNVINSNIHLIDPLIIESNNESMDNKISNIYNKILFKYDIDLLQYDQFNDNISYVEILFLERFLEIGDYIPDLIDKCNEGINRDDVNSKYWERKKRILTDEYLFVSIIQNELFKTYTYKGNYKEIPIVIIYPQIDMRNTVENISILLSQTIYRLEKIFGEYPEPDLFILYGFSLDTNSIIQLEDKETFDERNRELIELNQGVIGGIINWHQLLPHELSHSYFESEAITQFLEIYIINLITQNSSDTRDWKSGRNDWTFNDEGYIELENYGSPGLLKIYNLIGQEKMELLLNELYISKNEGIWKDFYINPVDENSISVFIELCKKYAPEGLESEISKIVEEIYPPEPENKIFFSTSRAILLAFIGTLAALTILYIARSRTSERANYYITRIYTRDLYSRAH